MQWLQNNWFWIALAVGFVAMHRIGHGGHRHGHDRQRTDGWRNPNPANDATAGPGNELTQLGGSASRGADSNDPALRGPTSHAGHAGSRHRHGC